MENGLKPKERRFLEAIFTTRTIKEAEELIGISNSTSKRIRNKPEFKKEYERMQTQLKTEVSRRLQSYASRAVDVLGEVAFNEDAKPADRIRAAQMIIDNNLKLNDLNDVLEEVEKLKKIAGGK